MLVKLFKQYKKAVVGAMSTIISAVLVAFMGDGIISFEEFVNIGVLGATAISVGIAPNVPYARYTKMLLAAVGAGLTVLLSVYMGGISPTEWAQIGIAVANAFGVWKARNEGDLYDRMK
jgi:hypothetical protein